MMIILNLILFFWALSIAYKIGKIDGISFAYDYIAANIDEFLKSIKKDGL